MLLNPNTIVACFAIIACMQGCSVKAEADDLFSRITANISNRAAGTALNSLATLNDVARKAKHAGREIQEEGCDVGTDGSIFCYTCSENGSVCITQYCPPEFDDVSEECACAAEANGDKCDSCDYCGYSKEDFSMSLDCNNVKAGAEVPCENEIYDVPEPEPYEKPEANFENGCEVTSNGDLICTSCSGNICLFDVCPSNSKGESDCDCEVNLHGIKCKECNYCGNDDWTFSADCTNIPLGNAKGCDSYR